MKVDLVGTQVLWGLGLQLSGFSGEASQSQTRALWQTAQKQLTYSSHSTAWEGPWDCGGSFRLAA